MLNHIINNLIVWEQYLNINLINLAKIIFISNFREFLDLYLFGNFHFN